MTLTEIRAILAERGLAPQRRFGQHFLHDENLCRWLVREAGLEAGEAVWEIGPGLGSLTGALIGAGHRVRAVEIDRGFARFLEERFGPGGMLEVFEADAVAFCESGRLRGRVVMGNLPYNVTTPLIMALVSAGAASEMLFMVQEEAADRLVAQPGEPDYGAVSVLVQSRCRVAFLRRVPPSVFYPEPAVDSAIIRLSALQQAPDDAAFAQLKILVKRGFSNKRKQLAKLLAGWSPGANRPPLDRSYWFSALQSLGIRPDARAEDLAPKSWQALAAVPRGPETKIS